MPQFPSLRKNDSILVVIFSLALISRLAYWWFVKNNYFFDGHPSSDVLYYQEWAREISRVNWVGTKTFWGLPLYPYFFAVLDRLMLGNMALIRLVHLVLGAFNCVLTCLVARRIFSGKAAVAAGILMAVNFTAIHYDWLMMPVTLIVLLSLIIVLSLIDQDKIKTRREWLILGLLSALAVLGDGKMIIFFCLALGYLGGRCRACWKGNISRIFLPFVAGMALILVTTGYRNQMIGGDWVWISAQSGLSLYVGNNPQATGVFDNPSFIRPTHQGQDEDQVIVAEILTERKLSPGQVSRFWRDQAIAFIRHHPPEYLKLLGNKLRLFFTETESAFDLDLLMQRDWKRRWDINGLILIFPLAMIGMMAARSNANGTVYLNFMILSQLIFTLIFFLTNRHRASILPFLIIYESYAMVWLVDHLRQKDFKPLVLTAACAASFACLFPPETMAARDVDFYRFTKSGSVYEKRNKLDKAVAQYRQALAARPFDTNAMFNLADVFVSGGDFTTAGTYYQQILAINPYQVDALYNLGFVQAMKGEEQKSLETYQKLLQLQPDSPDTLLQVALTYQRIGQCELAQNYYTRLMRVKPQFQAEISQAISQCNPEILESLL